MTYKSLFFVLSVVCIVADIVLWFAGKDSDIFFLGLYISIGFYAVLDKLDKMDDNNKNKTI